MAAGYLLALPPTICRRSLKSLTGSEYCPPMAPACWSAKKEAEEVKKGRPLASVPLKSLDGPENGPLMGWVEWGGAKEAEAVNESRPLASVHLAIATLLTTMGKEAEVVNESWPVALIPTFVILPRPCPKAQCQTSNSVENAFPMCRSSLRGLGLTDSENGHLMSQVDWGVAKEGRPLDLIPPFKFVSGFTEKLDGLGKWSLMALAD